MSRVKTLSALVLLLAGFAVVTGPYMNLKGAIFPKKNVGQFTNQSPQMETNAQSSQVVPEADNSSKLTVTNIAKAFGKFAENTGETLMWFFVPSMLLGIYRWFKGRKWYEPEPFFIITLIMMNLAAMIWLYCRHGYMSDRHTLPLLIIPILFVPAGLENIAGWLEKRYPTRDKPFWFRVLLIIGICVCIPKLFSPIRIEKHGYRAAAEWLKANTDPADTVAVPDERISFYAERPGLVYEGGNIAANTVYTVQILKEQTPSMESAAKIEYEYVAKRKNGVNAIIYKNL